jgi:hypothetical protein
MFILHTDPQSAFRTLAKQLENVVIDIGGAQDYILVVDSKT